MIGPLNLDIHLVVGRAKKPDSVLAKVRRKAYGRPSQQLTDQVGIRIITYYQDDVDKVAAGLRGQLEIDEKRSVDKRGQLDVQKFGYRSVHLIARFGSKVKVAELKPLSEIWFEIQIRSIFEHAWAEIEHEVNYKSGINFPKDVLRKFGAIAGSLEILEGEFVSLRREAGRLIDSHKENYSSGKDSDKYLDAARLLAWLEVHLPEGLSWRQAAAQGTAFPPRIEAICVEALQAVGIKTGAQLERIFKGKQFRNAAKRFSSSYGLAPAEISHFAATVIAIGTVDKKLIRRDYPELVEDPAFNIVF
jgi:Uncharacterized protein conserved in bacteria